MNKNLQKNWLKIRGVKYTKGVTDIENRFVVAFKTIRVPNLNNLKYLADA